MPSNTIKPGVYDTVCCGAKYYSSSNTVALMFKIDDLLIKKVFKVKNIDHRVRLLDIRGSICRLTIVNYSNGTQQRITRLLVKLNNNWITIYNKNGGKKHNIITNKPITSILIDIEKNILGPDSNIKLSGFLYENLSQLRLVKRFLDNYDQYIKVFCSKYGFVSKQNTLGNREYVVDVSLCDRLWNIAKRRQECKCERFNVSSISEKERILRNEIQGVIGEETKVKFFNALWEFLSINKRITINDSLYDSFGDMGVDFSVGVFNIDVKQRNKSSDADLILNKKVIKEDKLILLITCLKSHKDQYYIDLYNFADHLVDPSGRFVHQSVLASYTTAKNYGMFSSRWRNIKHKFILDYYCMLSMDNYIKLMIIEALKEEVHN